MTSTLQEPAKLALEIRTEYTVICAVCESSLHASVVKYGINRGSIAVGPCHGCLEAAIDGAIEVERAKS